MSDSRRQKVFKEIEDGGAAGEVQITEGHQRAEYALEVTWAKVSLGGAEGLRWIPWSGPQSLWSISIQNQIREDPYPSWLKHNQLVANGPHPFQDGENSVQCIYC